MHPTPACRHPWTAARAGASPSLLVARDAELGALRGALADARRGQPRLVLVEGPAGIGKSALVDRFLEEISGAVLLRAIADESESSVELGFVDQLLRSARAPGVSFGSGEDDPVRVGARLLDLLGTVRSEGPVVVRLEDIHWADAGSLRSLLFAFRRLALDAVLVVAVARDAMVPETLRRLANTRLGIVLSLGGLEPQALQALAASLGMPAFPMPAARRLYEHTLGNPLYARALLEEVAQDAWLDDESPLPAPRSFSELVAGQMAACGLDAQRLVRAAAVLGHRCSLVDAAALAGVKDALAACDDAANAGLVCHVNRRGCVMLAFGHPLIQAAVYGGTDLVERIDLHSAAAAQASDQGAALRHRFAATPGQDDTLAAELDQHARAAAARGALSTAAATFVQASRKSANPDERARRLLAGVDWMLHGGHFVQAGAYREEVAALPGGIERDRVLGHLIAQDRPDEADGLYDSAWDRSRTHAGSASAARVAHLRAQLALVRLRGAEGVTWSRRALALASPEDPTVAWATGELALGLAMTGQVSDGIAHVDAALRSADAVLGEDGLPLQGHARLAQARG